MGKKTGKMNIALFTAAVILCLTLFTTHLTSGLYARYTMVAASSDNARVARFSVTADADDSNAPTIQLTEDNPEASYTFTVSGDTETAWEYDVIVKQAEGKRLPDGVSLTMVQKGVGIALPMEFEETQQLEPGFAYRVQSVQRVTPGSHSAQYTIYFSADYNVLTDAVKMDDITVSVHATQID